MPHILVQHTPAVAQVNAGLMLGALRGKLRSLAATHLSIPDRELAVGDFSIMFLESGGWDVLMQDIQVTVFAHADPERVKRADELAEVIATACEEVIHWAVPRFSSEETVEISFSVTLVLGQVGFYRSSETLGVLVQEEGQ
jgi:hypothetical protein